MTSFIPSITLPGQVFANPISSILLPIALGASMGLVVRRMLLCSHGLIICLLFLLTYSQRLSAYVSGAEATSAPTAAPSLWPCMDDAVWTYGVRRVQSVEHRNVVPESKHCGIDEGMG